MTKFEKIEKFTLSNLHLGLAGLQRAIEEKFSVGVYLDIVSKTAPRPRHTNAHVMQIWYKRGNNWVRSAGWIMINKNAIVK